jgi:chemotaxis protein histidine kinase CheA
MRQALTAKGQLDAWMRSSEAALTNMGVEDIMVDENSLHIEGKHPEHGPIGIDYMIPEAGKTRMVIQVDDPQMITAFKRAVTPVFKNVIKELKKLEAEQAETEAPETAEEQAPAEETPAAETEAPEAEGSEAEAEAAPAEQKVYEAPEKPQTEETQTEMAPPKKAKKGKGGLIALIIILIVVAAGAASYFLYFRNHGGIPFLSKSSTTSSSQSSNSSSKKSSSGSSTASTDNNTASTDTNTANTANSTDATAQAGTITQAQYNQINNGMTYDQVKQLIGSDGTKLSESTYKDAQGNTINVQIYYWKGNGSSDSNANITFQGGAVASKSSYGLK